jgi:hypothetical protein
MKRYTQSFFIVAVAGALALVAYFYFSGLNAENELTKAPVKYRSLDANTEAETTGVAGTEPRLSSAIELGPDETLLDIYSLNLDYDDDDEQILVVRKSGDSSATMRIIVADYSSATRRWSRAWEGSTLATKVRTFQLAVYDLVGDHNLNIVCVGINDANQQTMTVFWKTGAEGGGPALNFTKVFETEADAVTVETSDRPDSYKLGQSNAESWPISVWRSDAGSDNFLDQVKETWVWSFHDRGYVKTAQERIPGASIARQMAESILDGKADTFETWLNGIWYKESIDPLSDGALFITFQPRDGNLLFSGEGVVEIYQWESSNPTRFGLYIAARNQSVRNLRRLLDIELSAADTINVRVFQDLRIKADISGRWNGRYRKLSAETAKAFRKEPSSAANSDLSLDGLYISPDGSTLTLSNSAYTWARADGLERGGFGIFKLQDSHILDLRAISKGDLPSSQRSSWIYRLGSRSEDGGAPITTLSLQAVRIGMDGVAIQESGELILEKREE